MPSPGCLSMSRRGLRPVLRAPAHGHEAAAVVPRADAVLSRAGCTSPRTGSRRPPDPPRPSPRRPPDPDRNRSTTLTWPSSAYGAVPDSVRRPTDAPNSPPSGRPTHGPAGQPVLPLPHRRAGPGAGHRAGTGMYARPRRARPVRPPVWPRAPRSRRGQAAKAFRVRVPVFVVADTRRRETSCRGTFGHPWHDLSAHSQAAAANTPRIHNRICQRTAAGAGRHR